MHILSGECVQYGCDILYDNLGTMGGNQKQAEAGGIRSFIAGGTGGICTVVSGQPFDTIKVTKLKLSFSFDAF